MNRTIFGYELPRQHFSEPERHSSWWPARRSDGAGLDGPGQARGLEPASPVKMAMGLALLAAGYLVMCFGVKGLQPGVKVSMFFLVMPSISCTRLRRAVFCRPSACRWSISWPPPSLPRLLMAVWFLANAAANYLAGYMSSLYPDPKSTAPKPRCCWAFTSTISTISSWCSWCRPAVASVLRRRISPRLISIMKARETEAA